jgi:choline-sulfatase
LPRGQGRPGTGETERHADETTARVLEWLGARAESPDRRRPWCLWIHYFDPHAAYEPPPEYFEKFATHPYDGEIAFVDAQIGRVFDRLTATDDLANTVVLLTADHGESLGEHGEETHGVFIYDATLRVPWIVAGPRVPAGRIGHVVARGVDILPTLLDLTGVAAPAALDGRSLRPAIDGRSMTDEPVYVESLLAYRQFGWAALHGLRDARWKYVDAPAPELYDLATDVTESVNRAAQQADRTRSMAGVLELAIKAPAQNAAQPVTRDTADRLRALGYIGASGPPPQRSSLRDPKDHIRLITRLEHAIADTRRDPARAATELKSVLAEDAGITVARRQLAVTLAALADHQGVVEQITTLQAAGAATAEDLLLLAESFRIMGRASEAARAIDEAARRDPRSPEVPLTQARAFAAEGRADEAARAYQRALDLAPDNPEALVGLGNIALRQGDLAGAGRLFERVLVHDPTDLPARTGRALVLGRQGQMPEAIALLQQVVRDAPSDGQALAGLGAALARSGSPGAAVPYFERAVIAGLRTPSVLNGLGFAKLESGDRAGALEALRESLSIEPQQPGVQQAVHDLTTGGPVRPGPAR